MNKKLGTVQMYIGSIIVLLGIASSFIAPFIGVFVILFGSYVAYLGYEIKKGQPPYNQDK